jgi:hypothetical protein
MAIKGSKQNPQRITVRQESSKNNTLSVTLSKSVLDILDDDKKIKKGDILAEWGDPTTKTIYLRRISTAH